MQTKLVKMLLSHQLWVRNRHIIVPEMFPELTKLIHDALAYAHDKYQRDLTLAELHNVVLMRNPVITEAQKETIQLILNRVDAEPPIGEDLANDILAAVWREEAGRKISMTALSMAEGKASIHDVNRVISELGGGNVPDDAPTPITTDVSELLDLLETRASWKFNIPSIDDIVPGISGGEFCILFGRVESGKTAAHISLACAPGGFIWQGAKVHLVVNEEPAIRTMMRCISAATGMTKEEIRANKQTAAGIWSKVKDNITIIDDVNMSMVRLSAYASNKKPDVLIIDQLDKVYLDGAFARRDEMLGETYQMAREIGKRHDCAVIGVTQASFAAEGKTQVHFSMMAESRTSKAAEADLVIGIGKDSSEPLDTPNRFLTISKNKISGIHTTRPCILQSPISRFIS